MIERNPGLKGVLIQHTRQKMDDHYDLTETIEAIRSVSPNLTIITDDNYAAMKVEKIGTQAGADLATFSLFKLLGPEGIGLILGKERFINQIEKLNYSGGSQVQGYEALEAIRGLVYAPVMLAIQANVNEELVRLLNNGEVAGVKKLILLMPNQKYYW